jgi:predicted NUDIX family phosphoesterase
MSIERADGTCESQHHVKYNVGVLLHRRAVPDAVCRRRSAGRRRHRAAAAAAVAAVVDVGGWRCMSIERADGTCKSQHHVKYNVGVLLHRRAVPDAACRHR